MHSCRLKFLGTCPSSLQVRGWWSARFYSDLFGVGPRVFWNYQFSLADMCSTKIKVHEHFNIDLPIYDVILITLSPHDAKDLGSKIVRMYLSKHRNSLTSSLIIRQ